MERPREQPAWTHYRVIHTKHPPMDLFESSERMLLGELESATSDRAANWRHYVTDEDARFGEGWAPVMAAFCYGGEARFSSSERGAYYAAQRPRTALREWAHHTALVWQAFGFTKEVSATVRCYTGRVVQPLVDLRSYPDIHDPDDYTLSQHLATTLVTEGEYGILYRSVRDPGYELIALLRPPATTPVTQSGLYVLRWSGAAFTEFAHAEEFQAL